MVRTALAVLAGCGAVSGLSSCAEGAPAPVDAPLVGSRLAIAVPPRADGPLALSTRGAAISVEIRFQGAQPAERVAESSVVSLYPSALGPGVDLVRARSAEGVEDWLVFPEDPGHRTVRMILAPRAAGLRLVERTLELLDEEGAPRLRMAPPWVVDATGRKRDVEVALGGCDADRDPRAPWGRPVTPAGAPSCEVDLQLPHDLVFPAVLDPLWTDTLGMVVPRALHAALRLDDGHVLIAGGAGTDADQTSAELFDPGSDTFATTGSLSQPRRAHTLTRLSNGRALAIGGDIGLEGGQLASVERYDPGDGTWLALSPLAVARSHHAVVTLVTGEILVTGSADYTTQLATRSVERCDANGAACTLVAPMIERRGGHSATLLPDGRVLVIGGAERQFSDGSSFHLATELYDPGANTWSVGPALPAGRVEHSVVTVRDGRRLVLGGTSLPQGMSMPDEVLALDLTTLSFDVIGQLDTPRWLHAAAPLPNGRVLLAGRGTEGYGIPVVTAAEAFDPEVGASVPAGSIPPRAFATATALEDGRVLVAGGKDGFASSELGDALLFGDRLGSPCDELDPASCPNGECTSSICSEPPPQGTGGAGGGGGGGGASTSSSSSGSSGTTSASSAGGGGSSSTGGGGNGGGGHGGAGGDPGSGGSGAATGGGAAGGDGTSVTAGGGDAPATSGGGSAPHVSSASATSSSAQASSGGDEVSAIDRSEDDQSFYGCVVAERPSAGSEGRRSHSTGLLMVVAAWLAARALTGAGRGSRRR